MRASINASASTLYTIQVTNATTNESLGYVSKLFNAFGEYTLGNQSNAMIVTSLGSSLFNSNPSYPTIGAISGYANSSDDLGVGSFHYAYIGGISSGGSNSYSDTTGYLRSSQTSIWSQAGNQLLAQWTNPDNSAVSTPIVLVDGFFVLTGDTNAFRDQFGMGVQVNFTLEAVPQVISVAPTASEVPEPSTVVSAAAALLALAVRRLRAQR